MSFNRLISLKSQVFLGFVVAILPLLLAVWFAALGMRETTALSKRLNSEVFEQTKTIRVVLQKVSDVERKARLFVLLSDPALRQPYERQSYEGARTAFNQSIVDLLEQHVDNKVALLANELAEKEKLIYQQIIVLDDDNNLKLPVDEAFQGLRESSYNLSREFENHVDREFDHLSRQSELLEQRLFVKSAALLGLSLVWLVALLKVIGKSLAQLNFAIRRLATGASTEAVVISGPADLSYLGTRLEWLRTHLLELERSKQQFMVNFAREIDEPLDDIRTGTERLSLGIDEEQQQNVQLLLTNIERIEQIRDEFLRFGKIGMESEMMQKVAIDLTGLLEAIIQEFQPRLERKSLTIKMQLQAIEFHGCLEQIRTVIEQLLANAVKYSPTRGEIRIELNKSNTELELIVEDDGPGIPREQRDKIFEPFVRGHAISNISATASCGLGLAMVKQYVSQHCGSIEFIEPRHAHHGACVRVQIPFSTPDH